MHYLTHELLEVWLQFILSPLIHGLWKPLLT